MTGKIPCDFGCFGEISVRFPAPERIALTDSGRGRFGSLARDTVWFRHFLCGVVDTTVGFIWSGKRSAIILYPDQASIYTVCEDIGPVHLSCESYYFSE